MGKKDKRRSSEDAIARYTRQLLNAMGERNGQRALVVFSNSPHSPALVFGSCCRSCTDRMLAQLARGEAQIPLAPNDPDYAKQDYADGEGPLQ